MDEATLNRAPLLFFFTETLRKGAQQQLSLDDLPELPPSLCSVASRSTLGGAAPTGQKGRPRGGLSTDWIGNSKGLSPQRALDRALRVYMRTHMRQYGWSIVSLGVIKVLSTLSAFLGPVMLSRMVSYIENGGGREDLTYGLVLVGLLTLSFVVSSLLNSAFNVRANLLYVKLTGGLSLAVFERVMALPTHAWSDLGVTEAQVCNLIQSDVEYAGDVMRNVNDLWTLPLQIAVAFYLLYTQVQTAFLAGVLMIVVMIPVNSLIATRIGVATADLMKSRDLRIQTITDALKQMRSIIMSGLEDVVVGQAGVHRSSELAALARRKYLDALCVLLWAVTPVLVPFATFAVTIVCGQDLSAAAVFTTLSLLNMLIFPMNAFPWIVMGFIEARVSILRLVKVLASATGDHLYFLGADGEERTGDEASIRVETKGSGGGGGGNDNDDDDDVDGFADDYDRSFAADRVTADGWHAFDAPKDHQVGAPGPLLAARGATWTWTSAERNDDASKTSALAAATGTATEGDTSGTFVCGAITAQFPRGHLSVVLGSVASGKTALLLGLLGEGRLQRGNVVRPPPAAPPSSSSSSSSSSSLSSLPPSPGSGVSYCAQVPGTLSGRSVRDNIALAGPLDEERYRAILRGLSLDRDCAAWPDGDGHHVKPGSSNLSGGQRLRIGVARALYARRASAVLLDDPFSALDRGTSETLLRFILEEEVGAHGRLVVLATHSVHLFEAAARAALEAQPAVAVDIGNDNDNDNVNVNNDGHVATPPSNISFLVMSHGKLLEGEEWRTQLRAMVDAAAAAAATATCAHAEQRVDHPAAPAGQLFSTAVDAGTAHDGGGGGGGGGGVVGEEGDLGGVEDMRSGHIDGAVFAAYFSAAGWPLCVAVVCSTALMQATASAMNFWLACWANPLVAPKPSVPSNSSAVDAGTSVGGEGGDTDDVATSLLSWLQSLWPSLALPQLLQNISNVRYLEVAGALAALNFACAVLRSFLFARGGLVAARVLYTRLSRAVFGAGISFFEKISVGKIVNRLGSDTEVVDDQLPFMLNILMAQVFLLTGSFFVIGVTDPAVIIVLAGVLVVYYRLQRFYRASSRELRRLGSVHRSPVVTLVADCVSNAATLRALGGATSCGLSAQFAALIDRNLRVCLAACVASQWLSVRLQLLGALIAASLALSATVTNALFAPTAAVVSPGLLGLSLSLCLTVVGNLNDLVGTLSATEQEMVSMERVMEYMGVEDECKHDEDVAAATTADDGDDDNDDDGRGGKVGSAPWQKLWRWGRRVTDTKRRPGTRDFRAADRTGLFAPLVDRDSHDVDAVGKDTGGRSPRVAPLFGPQPLRAKKNHPAASAAGPPLAAALRGDVCLREVYVRYGPTAVPVLRGASALIPAGSVVSVIGCTGAGKSTLLRLLLRLTDYSSGSVTVGGRELRTVGRRALRRLVSVVPQDPWLFAGTVRQNIDPFGAQSDAAVLAALLASGFIDTLPGDHAPVPASVLDMAVAGGGQGLSQGQKQLLCLARALARAAGDRGGAAAPMLMLDEATAAVDAVCAVALYRAVKAHVRATGTTTFLVGHSPDAVEGLCNVELRVADGMLEMRGL